MVLSLILALVLGLLFVIFGLKAFIAFIEDVVSAILTLVMVGVFIVFVMALLHAAL